MGTTYTSKASIRVLKQHTCVGCGGKFSYALVRQIKGEGSTAEKAEIAAQHAAAAAVENDVDFNHCPHCGIVQPDMVSDVQQRRLFVPTYVAIAGVVLALILGLTNATTLTLAAQIAMGVTAIAAAVMVWGSRYNPNGNLTSNRAAAQAKLRSGGIQAQDAGQTPSSAVIDQHGGVETVHWIGLGCALAALAAASMPVLLTAVNGWPTNTTCYPEIVGPGDTTRFYFNQEIKSIKGMWHGTARANIAAEGAPPIPKLTASAQTKDSTWGDTISGKSVSNATNKMYADVTIGDVPEAAGRTVKLDLQVRAEFPVEVGGGFDEQGGQFAHTTSVVLAPPKAGSTFFVSSWLGQSIAVALLLGALFCFHRGCVARRAKSLPTRVALVDGQ